MIPPDPAEHVWWLTSRAAGVVALLCVAVSVGIGLAMAGRVARRPALARGLLAVHEHSALAGMVATAVHGIALLGDAFLDPGVLGILVPLRIEHARPWTAMGVVAGWLAVALGLSFYARERIGPARWRRLHRATLLVYLLSVAHTLGAGTDARSPWLVLLVAGTAAPVLLLLVVRLLGRAEPGAPLPYRVAAVRQESAGVSSWILEPAGRRRLPPARPGQFVTVELDVPGAGEVRRSWSLSGPPGGRELRMSVKREPGGVGSGHLHRCVGPGDVVRVGGPAGTFVLDRAGDAPVVLASAGIGVTPVLAMLHELAARRDPRPVWWVHQARSGAEHPFAGEVRELLGRLPAARRHVVFSRPRPEDRGAGGHDASGRLSAAELLEIGLPGGAHVFLCGPETFVEAVASGLEAAGVPTARVHRESFGSARAPAAPMVAFRRAGVRAAWDPALGSLLELAEARGVPAASSCRAGACHGCRVEVVEGGVRHDPPPPRTPPAGTALLCCAQPAGDVVLDV